MRQCSLLAQHRRQSKLMLIENKPYLQPHKDAQRFIKKIKAYPACSHRISSTYKRFTICPGNTCKNEPSIKPVHKTHPSSEKAWLQWKDEPIKLSNSGWLYLDMVSPCTFSCLHLNLIIYNLYNNSLHHERNSSKDRSSSLSMSIINRIDTWMYMYKWLQAKGTFRRAILRTHTSAWKDKNDQRCTWVGALNHFPNFGLGCLHELEKI